MQQPKYRMYPSLLDKFEQYLRADEEVESFFNIDNETGEYKKSPEQIEAELKHGIDKHSRRLICANIGLLLDYCMRFYERQFTTREQVNKDIIVRFERLLDDYFDSDGPLREGLPTVKYFADKVFLSANYFGDMIRKQTGQTASEYIQNKLIERAKEALLGTDKTTSEIAYGLGFQYPQHLSRMFKRVTGYTPNEFRSQN